MTMTNPNMLGFPAASFKVFVHVGEEWVNNGLRFPTEKEALRYAEDVSARWTAVKAYDVHPSADVPNAAMLRFGTHEKSKDDE